MSKYRMPAEWEPQERLWFSWPRAPHLWPGRMAAFKQALGRTIGELSKTCKLGINGVSPSEWEWFARDANCAEMVRENIRLTGIPTDDAWCRDHGPTFVYETQTNRLRGIDWNFDAWGGKFEPHNLDNALACRLLEQLEIEKIGCPFIGEGGGVEVDGTGTLMLTKSVFLNPNRNPDVDQKTVQTWLMDHLGCQRVYWFEQGLVHDDTDGHIDMFARFVHESAIVYSATDDASHPQYRTCCEIKEQLEGFSTPTGGHYDLIPVALPAPVSFNGYEHPATYLNFLLYNHHLVIPQYQQDKADMQARGLLEECFAGYKSVLFESVQSITEGGSIHCLTQQQPLGETGHNDPNDLSSFGSTIL